MYPHFYLAPCKVKPLEINPLVVLTATCEYEASCWVLSAFFLPQLHLPKGEVNPCTIYL